MSYPGQGTNIPESLGRGAWVVEPFIYLSLDDAATVAPPPSGQIDLGGLLPTAAGNKALKFGAARIASVMGITVDQLIQANRSGKLQVTNWVIPPKPGDLRTMRFRFTLDGRVFEITSGIAKMGRA